MNRVFQVIWSHAIGAWIVVSECASRRRSAHSHGVRGTFAQHRLVIALLAALGPWSATHAQSIFWDGNDTTANADGGNGTWQEGGTNWDSAANAGANTAWNGTLPNDAVFGGTAGTVTIAPAGVTAHNLTFNTTGYTLSGGTLRLGGSTPTISVTGSATVSSVVAGTVGVSKSGTGVLQLNAANTYTGVTRVQQGILRLNNAQALGSAGTAAANLIVSSGGEVDFQATSYAHNLTASGTLTIGGNGTWSGAPTLTANTTMSVSGITQTGAWADTGANVLSVNAIGGTVFAGTNTYTGATTLTNGQLALNSAGALSPNSNLVIAGNPAVAGWNDVVALTPNTASFTRALGTNANQVRWTGSGGFSSVGTGTQVVNIGGASAPLTWGVTPNFVATTGQLQFGSGINVLGGGTLDFQNPLVLPTVLTNYDMVAYNGIVGGTNARAKLSGTISGAGNLRFVGGVTGSATGMIELSGANTYTGNLVLSGSGAYGNVLLNNATAASPNGGLVLAGPANSTGNTLSLTSTSGDFTRALGTGANQIRWTGNGGFSAAFANHFVDIGGAGATMTWATGNFVPNASWLNLAATNAGNAEIDFRNPIDFNFASRTVNVGTGGTARLSGVLSNGGATYQGGGQVTPSAANTYTGITTIASGTTVVANTIGNGGAAGNLGAANNAATNLVFNSGTLAYAGAGETSDRSFTVGNANATLTANGTGALVLRGATAGAGAHTLTLNGTSAAGISNELSGVLSNTGGGTLNVVKQGTNTWRLSGASTYTGTTNVNAGVLEVSNLQNGGVASSLGSSSNAATN
ncbi:MAG TPA: autotransporter-associated beta strand repeat-containing protein, partial [Lysobacter sp.]|nr:autotransporter-associated beta strand repeat-containing protein [Lysobacter sp.]